MKRFASQDGRLGLFCILLALIALAVWVPLDTETGLVEKLRRGVRIGDAMLPVLALGFVSVGGVLAILVPNEDAPKLLLANFSFLSRLMLIITMSLVAMRWVGPLVVDFAGEGDYRALRDTAPWKYLGFIVGGSMFVAGLMALVEGRISGRGLLIGLLSSVVLVVLYDLPFDDLLLPPNGDV
ncbi:MAG: hypothetical protein NXH80_11515 [Rhodobacteraceae bacterium]|nr:hypothetical protein [Paracoccaceae bacterium]